MSAEVPAPEPQKRMTESVKPPGGGSLDVNPEQGGLPTVVKRAIPASRPDPHGVHAFAQRAQERRASEVAAQRERDGLTNLERVFGFTDGGFNKYMGLAKTRRISIQTLVGLSDEMAGNADPLVQYASGWAAAEAALNRRQPREVERDRARAQERGHAVSGDTLDHRMAAFAKAKERWAAAAVGLSERRQATKDPHRAADLLGFELRAMGALAFAPSMEAVATLLGGHELSDEEKAAAVQHSRAGLIDLGEAVVSLPGGGKDFYNTRNGMCNEILAALMLQDPEADTIIVPASLRQDNNPDRGLRGDLIGVSTKDSYPKTLIQVTSQQEEDKTPGARFIVNVSRDLALPEHETRPRDTLSRVIESERGSISPDVQAQLDMIAQDLRTRYAAYAARAES